VALPRLYDFTAGTLAVGDQVDGEFDRVNALLEGFSAAQSGADAYQAGVVAATDWASGYNIASGTGELTSAGANGGAAWLPGPSGGLVRAFTAPAPLKLKPLPLPAPGAWLAVGIELTASGDVAVVSCVSGAEQTSEANALANPPAVTAGKVRIRDVPIKNNAGVYEKGNGRDRRPWALGARSARTDTSEHLAGTTEVPGLTQRVECSGRPVLAEWERMITGTGGSLEKVFFEVDGVVPLGGEFNAGLTGTTVAVEFTPQAGSRLLRVKYTVAGAGTFVTGRLSIRELQPSANNGTS
jgi:hypothetical protein